MNRGKKDERSPRQIVALEANTIDFDLKIVRGFALSFFIYGLVYWMQIQEFLVPLPMVYFFIPVAGLLMFLRSIKWPWAMVLLFIPFVVVKDFTIQNYPNITGVGLIFTFLLWSGWAWNVFFREPKKNLMTWVLPVSQSLIWLLWLIQSDWVRLILIVLILMGATVYVRRNLDNPKAFRNVRVGLLIQLVTSLFLMQQFSYYWVSLG
ncbi:hypothetical protein [Parvicella tangerina]|uniref:Uncharacterized protein n=1 Tax=Parvicella tangerina TaxID=2829795 RepID=A0A916NFX2_9FLAO|nr:hypothetical protein [Parvicella tangerina]CAG5078829.1 hypothetical protein CRYO30217_00779 [Parvicella tangerina]